MQMPLATMIFRAVSFASFTGHSDWFSDPANIFCGRPFSRGAATGFVVSFIEALIDLIKTVADTSCDEAEQNRSKWNYSTVTGGIESTIWAPRPCQPFQGWRAALRNISALPSERASENNQVEREGVHVSDLNMPSKLIAGASAGLSYTFTHLTPSCRMQSLPYTERVSWVAAQLDLQGRRHEVLHEEAWCHV
jgi:hypothetical protein